MRGNGGKTWMTSVATVIARACDAAGSSGADEAATDRILLRTFWTSTSQVSRPGLAKVISLAAARDARAARTC
jgi:hypothetical protein